MGLRAEAQGGDSQSDAGRREAGGEVLEGTDKGRSALDLGDDGIEVLPEHDRSRRRCLHQGRIFCTRHILLNASSRFVKMALAEKMRPMRPSSPVMPRSRFNWERVS